MSAGVSPVSPIVRGTPAGRTQYDATAISPSVQKATMRVTSDPPSRYDPSLTTPRQPNDLTSGINIMA